MYDSPAVKMVITHLFTITFQMILAHFNASLMKNLGSVHTMNLIG